MLEAVFFVYSALVFIYLYGFICEVYGVAS